MGERTTHSKTVGYVPQGRDATIAYPYLDLVFENTYDAPGKLYMGMQGGKLVAEVHKMSSELYSHLFYKLEELSLLNI